MWLNSSGDGSGGMTQSKLPTLLPPPPLYTQNFLEEDLGERQRDIDEF